MERLIVVGGGYAGVMAAVRSARRLGDGAEVVLVSDEDALIERIRLHETAARGRDPHRPLCDLLRGTGVALVHARCDEVDLKSRAILVGGQRLRYDRLIVAIGSSVAPDAITGAREHAFVLERESAAGIGEAVERAAERGGHLVVVGGGLTGLEAATELAEHYPKLRVTLLTRGELGERMGDRARAHARRACARLGIDLREHAAVERIEKDAVIASGERIVLDMCIAAAGFHAPEVLRRWGFPTDALGRARVDASLRLQGAPEVYVAGDCAAVEGALGSPIPSGCKSALPMGALAGENAAASMRGGSQRPIDWRDILTCVSLGRRDGVVQAMRSDGTPAGFWIGGLAGAAVKEIICWSTVRSIELERDGLLSYRYPRVRLARALAANTTRELPS